MMFCKKHHTHGGRNAAVDTCASPRDTRRAVLAGAALAAPAILIGARHAAASGALAITAYDGFVPPAVQKQFEADTGTQVRVRLAASQAPELSLLTTERDHPLTDICTVVGARLHQYVNAGIIEPLDTARLKNWQRINPIFANADWLRVNGAVMAVPLVVGANVLVFDTHEVTPAPDSWGAMFDPKYRGRVTYDIEDFLLCTMLLQGGDPTFLSYLGKPGQAARAVDAARDKLIASKSQVVRFFDEGSELQQILTCGDTVPVGTTRGVPSRELRGPLKGASIHQCTWGAARGCPPTRMPGSRGAVPSRFDGPYRVPGIFSSVRTFIWRCQFSVRLALLRGDEG